MLGNGLLIGFQDPIGSLSQSNTIVSDS